MPKLSLQVTAPGRLDRCLLDALQRGPAPGLTRARLKELFRTQAIRLNGRPVEAARELTPGTHEVEIVSDEAWDSVCARADAQPSRQGAFLPVVYEDDELLVLNKRSGIPSVPLSASETETAVGAALAHSPELRAVGRGGLEPGLLHRLDTGTSGLIAFARNDASFARLREAWKSGNGVRKVYRALAPPMSISPTTPMTKSTPTPGEIRLWLGHDAASPKRMRVVPQNAFLMRTQIRGKPLETVTHIVQVIPGAKNADHNAAGCDYQIRIETGVMHQIRCTLAYLGAPIWGDPIYGGSPASRLWLHAWRLELPTARGTRIQIESALPEGWPIIG